MLDETFNFTIDSKLKKRYQILRASYDIAPGIMAKRLRECFEAVLTELEGSVKKPKDSAKPEISSAIPSPIEIPKGLDVKSLESSITINYVPSPEIAPAESPQSPKADRGW